MKIIYTKNAPEPVGPYSQAVENNGTYYFSGQIALKEGKLQNENIEIETKQVLKNIEAVLGEAKLKKTDIMKVSIFMTDLSDFQKVNEIYENFLNGHKPARETTGIQALPLGAKIEISLIAKK